MEVRIIRITGKKRPTKTVDLTVEEPLAKKSSADSTPTTSTSGEVKQVRITGKKRPTRTFRVLSSEHGSPNYPNHWKKAANEDCRFDCRGTSG